MCVGKQLLLTLFSSKHGHCSGVASTGCGQRLAPERRHNIEKIAHALPDGGEQLRQQLALPVRWPAGAAGAPPVFLERARMEVVDRHGHL